MDHPQRILITGASGQVGFELRRSLQGLGEVIAPPRSHFDLQDIAGVRNFVRECKPGIIVNAAAYTAVDKAESDRATAFAINAGGPAVLAEEAKRVRAVLLHYSTDYVFDGEKASPYVEDDPTGPRNVYGESKLAGEHALREADVPHLIFRTSWVYSTRGANFVLTMLKLAEQHSELKIVADQVGAPTWSRTIAQLTAAIVAQSRAEHVREDVFAWFAQRSGIYHLTATGAVSWADFAKAIFELRGPSQGEAPAIQPITTQEFPRPARRPLNSRLSLEKLRRVFGLQTPDWRQALSLCMEELTSAPR